jgi:hypothetical protein
VIGTRPPAIHDQRLFEATAVVRRLPLRWSDTDLGCSVDQVLARGYFLGAAECARVLGGTVPVTAVEGTAFGRPWPLLVSEGWTLAPALPVAVGREAVPACDGEYQQRADGVWREAAGAARLYLGPDPSRSAPGEPFDLLWYGDSERFVVRKGVLEVEDLFGRLSVPATVDCLERLLCRGRRVDARVLSGLAATDGNRVQKVEVRRPAALTVGSRWRDPAAFLSARADITRTRFDGGRLEGRTVGAETVVFEVQRRAEGWRLIHCSGGYAFTEFDLVCRDDEIVLTAELDDRIDALAPGLRGRLVFDLRSDLVALDRASPTQNR